MSGPAHVLVLRPIIERLRAQGHEVLVTARVYTQTLELLELHGMAYTLIGKHGGASRLRKLMRLIQRTGGMRRFGKDKGFDLAIAHGSNDIAIASRMLGIPEANMHDYEFAVAQHHVGCRLAKRVIFPESVPPERLKRFGVGPEKLRTRCGQGRACCGRSRRLCPPARCSSSRAHGCRRRAAPRRRLSQTIPQ